MKRSLLWLAGFGTLVAPLFAQLCGCDAAWDSYSKDNPDHCANHPAKCDVLEACDAQTGNCIPKETLYQQIVDVDCDETELINSVATWQGQANTLLSLAPRCTYNLSTIQDYWFGSNGLPSIHGTLYIAGNGATIARSDSAAANFRLLAVVGTTGETPSPGHLIVHDLTIRNFVLKGGDGGRNPQGNDVACGGGGGGGFGGAFYVQGQLDLYNVTLSNNLAQGGNGSGASNKVPPLCGGGGGMSGDGINATFVGGGGGGFFAATSTTGDGGGFSPTRKSGGKAGGGFGNGGGGIYGASGGPPGMGTTTGAGGAGGGGGGFGGDGGRGYDLTDTPGGAGGDGGGGGGGGCSQPMNYTCPDVAETAGGGGGGFLGNGGNAQPGGSGGGFGGGGGGAGVLYGAGGGGFGGGGGGAGTTAVSGGGGGGGGFGGGGGGGPFPGHGGFGGGGGGHTLFEDIPDRLGKGGFGGGLGVRGGGGGGLGAGGAVFVDHGSLLAVNSTFSGNVAQGGGQISTLGSGLGGWGLGGALFNLDGAVWLSNVTVTNNSAMRANNIADEPGGIRLVGGIYNLSYGVDQTPAVVQLDDSVLGDNGGLSDLYSDQQSGSATVGTSSVNVVMNCNFCDDPMAVKSLNLIVGQSPLLAPLADNGGLTQTQLPANNSPAIGQGNPDVCQGTLVRGRDQRGQPRPAMCTLGAVETLAPPSGGCALSPHNPPVGFLGGSGLLSLWLLLRLRRRLRAI